MLPFWLGAAFGDSRVLPLGHVVAACLAGQGVLVFGVVDCLIFRQKTFKNQWDGGCLGEKFGVLLEKGLRMFGDIRR
ncbi:hypothetical protein [Tranquillimonas rosea]|uniref:hypothetical protein n=1 Tax=Tranquillimonas rosea TaxID=641238 RepID=UPI00116034F2|nr:hypothetical protein [Tranquillimonas rosea]